jgi:hypothetical protein
MAVSSASPVHLHLLGAIPWSRGLVTHNQSTARSDVICLRNRKVNVKDTPLRRVGGVEV